MNNQIIKTQINFLVDPETVEKIDAIADALRRSRNQQFAFMVDEAYARLFPRKDDHVNMDEKGAQS